MSILTVVEIIPEKKLNAKLLLLVVSTCTLNNTSINEVSVISYFNFFL